MRLGEMPKYKKFSSYDLYAYLYFVGESGVAPFSLFLFSNFWPSRSMHPFLCVSHNLQHSKCMNFQDIWVGPRGRSMVSYDLFARGGQGWNCRFCSCRRVDFFTPLKALVTNVIVFHSIVQHHLAVSHPLLLEHFPPFIIIPFSFQWRSLNWISKLTYQPTHMHTLCAFQAPLYLAYFCYEQRMPSQKNLIIFPIELLRCVKLKPIRRRNTMVHIIWSCMAIYLGIRAALANCAF